MKLNSEQGFDDSENVCKSLGGHLPVIFDQGSHDALYSLVAGDVYLWLQAKNEPVEPPSAQNHSPPPLLCVP